MDEATERMDSLLKSALGGLGGDAVAIGAAVDGDTQIACRGMLAGEPVHGRTRFYGASVTKQIVGILVAQAVVRPALTIEDSITSWVPELPGTIEPVRLRHLLHHTSGLPDVADPAIGIPVGNADIIDRFGRLETSLPGPGLEFAYNNAGYVLLAEAVARSSGQPIHELGAELFERTGSSDSVLGGSAVHLGGRPDPPGTVGDGGLWTSVEDLTRWLQACNEGVFGAEVHDLAETTGFLDDGSPLDYAWGIRITPSAFGRVITHGGSWDRWLAKTVRIPECGVAVAVLSVGAAELEVSRTGTDLAVALAADVSGGRDL